MASWFNPAKLRKLVPWLVGLLALMALVGLARDLKDLGRIAWRDFALATLASCALALANYALRFGRWQMFLRHLGHALPASTSALCYMSGFAFTLSPGRAGELMRARYYARHAVKLETVAAGFVAERLLDFTAVAMLCLLGVGWLVTALGLGPLWASLALVAVLLLLSLPWWLGRVARRKQAAGGGALQASVAQACALLTPATFMLGLAIGLVAWALEGVGLWLLIKASGLESYSVWQALSVYAAGLMAGAISFIPGGLGGTEAVLMTLLRQSAMPVESAFAVTMLCRLSTLWLAIALGWLSVMWLGANNDNEH